LVGVRPAAAGRTESMILPAPASVWGVVRGPPHGAARACLLTDCRILSMPLGPSVVLTRSAMAMAPMKEAMRAFSPCARVVRVCGNGGGGTNFEGSKGDVVGGQRRRQVCVMHGTN